ncbi:retrovirus-related Pol polyprotein from transposon 297 [Trichonephila clavipes]|nr:retrovirus-related Pol polyprotein from transposon 297 [Trichonephila clavipes]
MTGNQLDVIIDKKPIRALVDSGASFSVISDKYRRFLKKVLFADAKSVMLKVADGNFVRPIGKCVLRVRINNRELPFEFIVLSHCSHDVILGWDFLEASQAVIDCGQNELVLEDICRDSTAPDAWNLYATRDYTLKPHSLTRITVSGYQTRGDINVVLDGSKHLLFEKNIATPSMVSTYCNGKSDVWVTNLQFRNQIIPRGMCIGQAEPLNEGHLCVISETSGCLDDQQETLESQMNCSLMMSPELSDEHRNKLSELLRKFSGLFTKTDKSTAANTNVKHRIFTGDHAPINQRAYRVSPTERRIIHEEVQKMLVEGIVQPSESPWSSPIVLVRRFCVDYRKLNSVTKKDVYPLPRIDDTLDCLKGAIFFSSMDLRSGYWQIEIDEADREKTAFITPEGLYEFKVMPFGLCNAPATFERMMDNLLRHFKWTMCLCYLDDIIVFSETFEDHLIRLRLVLKCLQEAGLKLNSKKCLFAAQEVKILGHLVSSNGVRPDPDKIKAVRNFPTPKNIHDIRSFLGLCSYFRRFIKGFCYLAEPLQSLLKSGVEFHWGPEEVEAFNSLKKALTSDPVLGMYDERAFTEIHTDASGYGIGAVLVQIQNNVEKVIAYASRTLTKAEKNYSTTERECLAIVWATNKFRLTYSGNTLLFGRGNGNTRQIFSSHDEYEPCDGTEKGSRPCEIKTFEQLIQNEEFRFIDGILCRKNFDPDGKLWLPVIPKHLRADILRHFHDAPTAGHLGFAKTYDRIRKRFYWPGMYRNVVRYVMHCRECQRRKSVPQRPPGRLVPIPPATAPFHRIGIDLLGRFPKSAHGNKWIIVCTDYSTRYAITKALPTAEVDEIAKFLLEEIVLRHGAPRVIITDRGAVFRSRLVSSLVDLCNIDHRFTTAYHPQTNGLTERFNKTLADMLSMYVDVEQKNWDEILPFVTFAYNTAKQETTGFTPFYLLHGREAETTLDTMLPFCPNDFDDNNITKIAARAEESRQLARVHTSVFLGSGGNF